MITIKLKSSNDEVFILQKLLRKVGYTVVVDGDFGPKTDKAIRDFQFSHSLIADGIVGFRTWDLLFAKAFRAGEEILGTDIYQHDSTEEEDFWNDVREKYYFCFVKATEGATYADPRFLEHMNKLKSYRILRGGYHFFRMMNPDVDSQVQNFLDAGVDYRDKGMLPPVLDVEPTPQEWKNYPVLTENRAAIAKRLKKWLTAVEKQTGKKPIIYTSRQIWNNILKAPSGFGQYPLWLANYTEGVTIPDIPVGWNKYTFWQYTENGTIGGNDGFDINRSNISYRELLKMAGY